VDASQISGLGNGDVAAGEYCLFSMVCKSLVHRNNGQKSNGKSEVFLEWFDRVK